MARYARRQAACSAAPPAALASSRRRTRSTPFHPFRSSARRRVPPRIRWTPGDRVRVALMGVVGFALAFAFGNWGLAHSTASNAALLITVEPTTLLVLSPLLLGERLSRRETAGAALTL